MAGAPDIGGRAEVDGIAVRQLDIGIGAASGGVVPHLDGVAGSVLHHNGDGAGGGVQSVLGQVGDILPQGVPGGQGAHGDCQHTIAVFDLRQACQFLNHPFIFSRGGVPYQRVLLGVLHLYGLNVVQGQGQQLHRFGRGGG